MTSAIPTPLVIIPCGGKKADGPRPARDLYVGSYFRACLSTALALVPEDRIRILSAKYGLVTLDLELAPYDKRMGEGIDIAEHVLRRQVRDQGLSDSPQVLVMAGKLYVDKARKAFPDAVDVLAGTAGMGEQLARLKELREDPAAALALAPELPRWDYVEHVDVRGWTHAVREGDTLTECARHAGARFKPVDPQRTPSCGKCRSSMPAWAPTVEAERMRQWEAEHGTALDLDAPTEDAAPAPAAEVERLRALADDVEAAAGRPSPFGRDQAGWKRSSEWEAAKLRDRADAVERGTAARAAVVEDQAEESPRVVLAAAREAQMPGQLRMTGGERPWGEAAEASGALFEMV